MMLLSRLASLDLELLQKSLDVLNASTILKDIPLLKSIKLHPLKSGRSGQWAINVNGLLRICFKFKDGHAFEVEIQDYR